MKKSFCFLTILIFLCLPLRAADFTQLENAVHSADASADYTAIWKSIKRLLTEAETDWRSSLYYSDARSFADVVGYKESAALFKRLADGLNSMPPSAELSARRIRLMLEYDRLNQQYNPQSSALPSLKPWRLTGPYRKYGKADLAFKFAPELGGWDQEKEPLRLAEESAGGYADCRVMYPQKGIVYASSSFTLNKPALLHVLCESRYILFINGKPVFENDGRQMKKYRIVSINKSGSFSVTIKVESKSGWKFKIFATDEDYNLTDVPSEAGVKYSGDVDFSEKDLYPFAQLKAMPESSSAEKALKHYYLGAFYDWLGSPLAIDEYRAAAALHKGSNMMRYHYGLILYWFRQDEDSSWRDIEARRIIASVSKEDPSFAAANFFKLAGFIEEKNIAATLKTGTDIANSHPYDFLSHLKFLGFLNEYGYGKEFLELHGRFAKNFPDSVYRLLLTAAYQKKHNKAAFALTAGEILKVYKDEDILTELLNYHTAGGRYKPALELLDENEWFGGSDLARADILAASGDYDAAKKIYLRLIAKGASPLLYYKAGLAEYLRGGDPAVYWQNSVAMEPSLFYFKEYIDYLSKGVFDVPLRESDYSGDDIKSVFASIAPYEQGARIINRNRIFSLEKEGSRVFCQDIIHLNNEKGIEHWGEYKIPYHGTLHPVIFRVYYDDATFSDTYSVNRVDSSFYVNLFGLKKNSILVMQYIVDNPAASMKDSAFYTLSPDFLQAYEEPLDAFKVSIVAARDMRLVVQNSGGWEIVSSEAGDKNYYGFSGKNLPVVYLENFSGSDENSLPWYGFSTIESVDDLAVWYGGLTNFKSYREVAEYAETLRGVNAGETLKKVYNNISREVLLTGNSLFNPDTPQTTLYRKSGSVEDKAIAARAVLSHLGITSHLALARSKTRPRSVKVSGPGYFDSVLLYVPLSDGGGHWCDFSNANFAWGAVSPWLAGQEAWILADGVWRKKNIEVSPVAKKGKFTIEIDAEGNGKCRLESDFPGIFSAYRRLFANKQNTEDGVNYYCGDIFPTFSLEKYSVENADNHNDTLKLSAEGTLLGVCTVGRRSLVLEPIKNKSLVHQYIAYPTRTHPLIMPGVFENETYEYSLPKNFTSEEIDKKINFDSPLGYARFGFTKKKNSDKFIAVKEIFISENVISPEQYEEFLNFCLNIRQAESFNITFTADSK
ncbi:MAG: hypothetical protein FWG13_06810 [Leptospirales bacterium]|nr:hypothetical protein [Leptospirales bacterium]